MMLKGLFTVVTCEPGRAIGYDWGWRVASKVVDGETRVRPWRLGLLWERVGQMRAIGSTM